MILHPWHEVGSGYHPPDLVTALIEIPMGKRTKYEIDKESGLLKLDRILQSSMVYPANYGFIPQSLGDDGDPLDILVLSKESIQPLCLVPARIIGLMCMQDQGVPDHKILAVAARDVATEHILSVDHLEPGTLRELKDFFESYTRLEGKSVLVPEFQSVEQALREVEKALAFYRQRYGNHNEQNPRWSQINRK